MDAGQKNKLNFIVNPNAGKYRTKRAIDIIIPILEEKNISYEVNYADSPKLAREIASKIEAAGEMNIIVIGGDGTFGEVLNGVKDPKRLNFGFIPAGTGNDFAKALGLSKDPAECLSVILQGETISVDYLQGASRRAINTISTGVDISIIEKYNGYKKRCKLNYYKALLKTVFTVKYPSFEIKVDDETRRPRQKYFVVAACNGNYFGGGMKISPHSQLSDGQMHFVGIYGMPKGKIIFRLPGFLRGKHIGKSYTEEYSCEKVDLDGGRNLTVNYDGELVYNEPFDVKIVKGGLNVFKSK